MGPFKKVRYQLGSNFPIQNRILTRNVDPDSEPISDPFPQSEGTFPSQLLPRRRFVPLPSSALHVRRRPSRRRLSRQITEHGSRAFEDALRGHRRGWTSSNSFGAAADAHHATCKSHPFGSKRSFEKLGIARGFCWTTWKRQEVQAVSTRRSAKEKSEGLCCGKEWK